MAHLNYGSSDLPILTAAALPLVFPEMFVGTARLGQVDSVETARTGINAQRRTEMNLRADRRERWGYVN